VIRLHACGHVKLRETRDVFLAQVLRVLDAEAAVACAVLLADALEDVEQHADGAIADCVDHHVQAGLVGAGDPRVHLFWRIQQQATILRCVDEGLVEGGGVRAE
jgi:hypothetical protein